MPNRFKIHWVCSSPSPYNDFLFQSLAADPEIDLLVHFRKKVTLSHPWSSPMAQGFPSRHYKSSFALDRELVHLALRDTGSLFIWGSWNHPTAWAGLNLLTARGRSFIIWTDTPNLHKRRTWIKDKLRSRWLKMIFHNALAVMGTGTPAIKALEAMGCPKGKIINFPYWVALPRQRGQKEAIPRNRTTFFGIGQLVSRKGYDLAITALEKVARRCTKRDISFLIFGDGPERNRLQSLSEKMGLTKVVTFYGWKEPELIHKEMRKADILVHPALWEPYGVVVLEAMAHAKPVIGSNTTMAVLDRVKHGVDGLIFKNRDVDQLAEYMAFFNENPDKIAEMGREARRTAEEWPVERGVEIIKKLLTGRL